MHIRNHFSAATLASLAGARYDGDGTKSRTQLQMLLSTREQLGDATVEILGQNVVLAPILMLTDKEAKDLHQMREQ